MKFLLGAVLDLEGGSKKHTTDFFKSTGHSLLSAEFHLVTVLRVPPGSISDLLQSPGLQPKPLLMLAYA